MFGAVLLMSWSRRISDHLAALDRTWRSVSSLDTQRVTRHGSSTAQGARRSSFQRELTLMNAFSSIRGIPHPKFHPLTLNLFWNPPLLLFTFQMSLMMLKGIPVAHSCLFMGGMVLVLLNNPLLAP
jgi:hypothetical protein